MDTTDLDLISCVIFFWPGISCIIPVMLCLKFEQINLKLRKCSRAPTMGGTVCIIQSSQCPSSGTRGEKSVADLPSTSLNGACLIAGFVTLFCLSVEQCHIFASTLCCYVEFYLSMKYISDSLLVCVSYMYLLIYLSTLYSLISLSLRRGTERRLKTNRPTHQRVRVRM